MRLERLLGREAMADCLGEALVDVVAEQRPQGRGIAGGKGLYDDLEGAAGALYESVGIEFRIGIADLREPGFRRGGSWPGGRRRQLLAGAQTLGQADDVVGRGLGKRAECVRLLGSRAGAEH